jgi:hypothetical protein
MLHNIERITYPELGGYSRDDTLCQYLIQELLSIMSGFLKLLGEALPFFESDANLRGNPI